MADTDEPTIEITHEIADGKGSYHLHADGEHIGELDYVDADRDRVFTHTRVSDDYEGQGLAARLVKQGLADARTQGLTPVGQCSYVAAYLRRHPEPA